MILMSNSTKNQYKQKERHIECYGKLYLAKKNPSINLLNLRKQILNANVTTSLNYNDELTVNVNSSIGTSLASSKIYLELEPNTDYTISLEFSRLIGNANSGIGVRETATGGSWIFSLISFSSLLTGVKEFSFNSGNHTEAYLWLYVKSTRDATEDNTWIFKSMMMTKGTTVVPYEKYGTIIKTYTQFDLIEENNCKILSFNINEKTDIYYTSLPYNTMSIVVDNEYGYFTDFDSNSIVRKLNSDCYVELYMRINEGTYYKIMTMKFNEISSSDYEKATLDFKSSISMLKNLVFKDNDLDFNTTEWGRGRLQRYLLDNYNIGSFYTMTANDVVINSISQKSSSPEDLILQAGTKYGTLEKACLTINDYQDKIVFKNFYKAGNETILLDYQMEKPIIKRENTYNGVSYNYYDDSNYEATNQTYNVTISGILTSKEEIRVYRDNSYKLNDVTINDITHSNNIDVEIITNANKNIIIFKIKGEINNKYTITINKANIYRKTNDKIKQKVYGVINDTSKMLIINETSSLNGDYYNFILNTQKIKANIQAKIFGLPYLEVGDTIELETELARIVMIITEINMIFDGGLIETIKGYELGWDALFPSDTLYPDDELYPNTPL